AGVGRLLRTDEPVAGYAAHLIASAGPARLDGLRLVLDCANGAASYLAGEVFTALGAHVEMIACEPDGLNINLDCGSLHPERMAQRVRDTGADAGVAFDGDADRAILADGTGAIFDGDRVLCSAGIHRAGRGLLPGRVVVGTIMSNLGLEEALLRYEIRLVRAPVGDRYVTAAMNEYGAALGGEKSGHILFPDISATGDGILTAIQTLRLCVESGRSLAEWSQEMREFPQRLVSVRVRERDGWSQNAAIVGAIHAAEARLGDRGRINVRPSGTEKLIRVMVEGPEADEVESVVQEVAGVIRAEIGA
ncbi:MAG TPA: hypothetical protein VM490_10605, partial [Armatimonadaceae bacterium]|nr:hypothetical protein [Armatimonadaceae bacterium]